MHGSEFATSINVPGRRASAFELAQLHKLEIHARGGPTVDQEAMERLSERGYVRPGLAGWKPTTAGLLALSRR